MRRALIIDDEEAVLKIITHFIEMKDMPIKIVGKATSGDEA
ncbi:TPA: two-component system response regulator, partial [Clostridioides difficile]|nr:two-component system response regulator [Clostridioides difficile]HBY8264696.1 two-component system response regulator [Clostridioides difficile]